MFAFLLPLVAALPGFLLKFVGSGVLETVLSHSRQQAASKNEGEKIKAGVVVRRVEAETERRKNAQDHDIAKRKARQERQIEQDKNPHFYYPMIMLTWAVGLYWTVRIGVVKTFGLDDFGIAIAELSEQENAVSLMVLLWWFGDGVIDYLKGRGK